MSPLPDFVFAARAGASCSYSPPGDLLTALAGVLTARSVIVGIGNPYRGDDGFGPAVIAALRGRIDAPLFDAGFAPENYAQRIAELAPDRILLLDAADLGVPAGTLRLTRPVSGPTLSLSTHTGGLELLATYWEGACRADCALLLAQPESLAPTPRPRLSIPLQHAVRRARRAVLRAWRRAVTAAPGLHHALVCPARF
jgi:hydrogenase 3 maturation protease